METDEQKLREEWAKSLKDLGDALQSKTATDLDAKIAAHEKKTGEMLAANLATAKEDVLKRSTAAHQPAQGHRRRWRATRCRFRVHEHRPAVRRHR